MFFFQSLEKKFKQLNAISARRVEEHGAQYVLFGVFAVINYIIPYFMWSPAANDHYSLRICLRLIAGILCFLLIIKEYWHKLWAPYLPLYWHATLLYCLPFLTTFMLFDSQGETFWLSNMILAMSLLAVLVDWRSFIMIFTLGVSSGYGFFASFGEPIQFYLTTDKLYWTTYMCFFSVMIAILFSRNNEKIAAEKLGAYKSVSSSIAHEMRTPLSSMFISAQGVQKYLPKLLTTYDIAQQNGLTIPRLTQYELKILDDFPNHLISISRRSLSIIDIFLTNFGALDKQKIPLQEIRMNDCIIRAISEYPFYSKTQRELVNYQADKNFTFLGNEDLVIHVFSNLLKNSFYQIQSVQKGEIKIWISEIACFNVVHFKDTAQGVKSSDLSKIFEHFYSSTGYGTGIGLAYCKQVMSLFGGKIACRSTYGEYTEMQLFFPKVGGKPL